MEINCPQCGRQYDIPEDHLGRPLKCLCKFNFRPKDLIEKPSGPLSHSFKSESQKFAQQNRFEHHDDETQEIEDVETNITDGDMDNFVNYLNDARTVLASEEEQVKAADAPKVPKPLEGKIEVEERKTKGSQKSSENDDMGLISQIQHEFDDVDIEDQPTRKRSLAASELVEESRVSGAKALPGRPVLTSELESQHRSTHQQTWQEKTVDFLRTKPGMFAAGGGGLFVVILIFTIVLTSTPQEEVKKEPDYLAELIKESDGVKQPLPKKKLIPKRAKKSTKRVAKKAVPAPVASKKSGATLYSQMLVASYKGDYKRVISLAGKKKLKLGSKSLLYEASLLDSSISLRQKQRVLEKISKERKRSPSSSIMVRTEALSMLLRQDKKSIQYGIEQLKSLQLTRPRDPLVYAYLGIAYHRLKKPKQALISWNQASTLEPRISWVLKKKEATYRSLGRIAEAIEAAKMLQSIEGEESQAHYLQAQLYLLIKEKGKAGEHFVKSFGAKDSFKARMGYSKLMLFKNPQKTHFHSEKAYALAQNSVEKRDALFVKARALCRLNKIKYASATFWRAYQADTNFLSALEKKGECEYRGKMYNRSARSYQRLLKKKPDDPEVWVAYGRALRKTRKTKPALAAFKRALEIEDSDSAHYEMASLYLALNSRGEAKKHARMAIKINPDNKRVRRLLASLK